MTGPEVRDLDNDGVRFTDAQGNPIAAERAKEVQRDVNGNVKFQQEGTASITGVTNTGVTNTVSATGATGKVNFDRVQGTINTGTADLSLLRDGSVLTSVSGVTSGEFVETAGTPNKSSPDWSLKANWGSGLGQNTIDTTNPGDLYTNTNSTSTITQTGNLSGTASVIQAEGTLRAYSTGTIGIFVNGTITITQNTNHTGNYEKISGTVTGSFTNPVVTWTGHPDTTALGGTFVGGSSLYGTLLSNVSGTANLTASRNQVTTVS